MPGHGFDGCVIREGYRMERMEKGVERENLTRLNIDMIVKSHVEDRTLASIRFPSKITRGVGGLSDWVFSNLFK